MLTIVSCFYNESLLTPFFLNHYADEVDKIIVHLDYATTDNTFELLKACPKVEIRGMHLPEGFDDLTRNEYIHSTYKELKEGWVLYCDADEFVYYPPSNIRDRLDHMDSIGFSSAMVNFSTPYRHHDDAPLDPSKPPLFQRRYGLKSIHEDKYDIKPLFVKAGLDIEWGVGQHFMNGNARLHPTPFPGVHWSHADPEIMEHRYSNRLSRLSPRMKQNKWGFHYELYEGQSLVDYLASHQNDPQIL